ncbi:unnamed protein product [Xylocopa violacea]|uniref:Uncharacterized protein n=1 Tax=Xylocopa violacea TaxID=135666 RepID=A0ABP1NLC6_XYLVO
MGLKWVRYTGDRETLPGMVVVGQDLDNLDLVVGRAVHDGDLLPAKAKPAHGLCYVSYLHREHTKTDFEILMLEDYHWVRDSNGHVPRHAVGAGRTSDGEMLYVGRCYVDGVPCVGKVHRSNGVLYAPYHGSEYKFKNYEVLVED